MLTLNKRANYFTRKISLFRNSIELQFRMRELWQSIDKSRKQRGGAYFYRRKEEAGRGCYGFSLTAGGGFSLLGCC